jgi:hypothetical protein
MNDKPTGHLVRDPVPFAGENAIDYRARIAAHRAEIEERRQRELLEQRSSINTPSVRIRIWERLHQIDLPRSPEHRLVALIAIQTGLTSEDVRDEQRLRAAPPAELPPAA